jgi:hypothetical protein
MCNYTCSQKSHIDSHKKTKIHIDECENMNAHLKCDKKKCTKLIEELKIVDEDEKSPLELRNEIIDILSCVYLPTMEIELDNEVPMSLTHELTQFTHGKTEQTLNEICERYLVNVTENVNNLHIIQIIITNKSLLETKQWKVRTEKEAEKRKTTGSSEERKKYETITIDILSSDTESNYHSIDKYIADIMKVSNTTDLPNVLIVCFHKKRIQDIDQLLNTFSGRTHMIKDIKVKFHLSFDEPDANLGLCSEFLKTYKTHKHTLCGIEFITATPFEKFWTMLKKHGIFTLLNHDKGDLKEKSYEEYLENYRQIKDHTHIAFNYVTYNPLEYIESVFSNRLISDDRRNIIFSPAHLYTHQKGVGSHQEVVEFYSRIGYTVFLSNGEFKGFIEPTGEHVSINEFITKYDTGDLSKGELRDVLRKWASINPEKNLVITGYFTIERGVTFQTEGFQFTHSIISDYHKKSLNKLLQLIGRLTGNKKYVDQSILICPQEIIDVVSTLVNKTIELRKENPENYNSTDFSNKNSTIPVKLTFIDDEFRCHFLKCYESGGKYKKSLHLLLKEAYQSDKIKLEDRNNVNIFTNDKKDKTGLTKMFDDIHKKIGTVRMYKNGDNTAARRFEQFYKAFDSYKASSQTAKPGEYNIDFAKDRYNHNNFTHEIDVAYITFRVD